MQLLLQPKSQGSIFVVGFMKNVNPMGESIVEIELTLGSHMVRLYFSNAVSLVLYPTLHTHYSISTR